MMRDAVPGEKRRLVADVYGRVQGVGFRYNTVERAQALGICGTVTNRWDGSVHVEAEGHLGKLKMLLDWLHHGPMMSHVSRVEHRWTAATGEFDRFEVV